MRYFQTMALDIGGVDGKLLKTLAEKLNFSQDLQCDEEIATIAVSWLQVIW